jgi:glycosyltransferase involved in cell wall biosynthesis
MVPQKHRRKILYVITKSNFGGAQRYVYNLASNLPREVFEVAVVLGGSGVLMERLKNQNVRTIPVPSMGRDMHVFKDVITFLKLVRIFRLEKPYIVHLNSSKAGGLGALAGRMTGVKHIIFTAHGWPTRESRPFFSRLLITFFSWLTAVCAHHVVTVSDADYHEASSWPFMKTKLVKIHNGVVPFPVLKRAEAQRELHIGHPNLLQVGTNAELHPNKNLASAIEAVALHNQQAHRPIEYTIISDGEERNNLENLIEKLGVKEFVHLAGFRKNATELLSAFDIFLLPSLKEGLPFALLEAGYAGLPIIATKTGGIPEIIEDGKSGVLIQPPTPERIYEALRTISNPLRTDFGITLKKKVGEHFMFPRMLKETLELYL